MLQAGRTETMILQFQDSVLALKIKITEDYGQLARSENVVPDII